MRLKKLCFDSVALYPLGRMNLICFADDGSAEGDNADNARGAGNEDHRDNKSLLERAKTQEKTAGEKLDGVTPPAPDGFDQANLPEDLRGQNSDEALGKVFDRLKGYTEKEAALGSVPQRAEDYSLKLDADTAKFFPNLETDPVIVEAKKWALEKGLRSGEFNDMLGGMLSSFTKAGLVPEPIDEDAEIAKLGDEKTSNARLVAANDYVGRLESKASSLEGQEKTDMQDIISELKLVTTSANGIKLVEFMMANNQETGVGTGEHTSQLSGPVTREKLQEMRKDDRYKTNSSKYDPDYRARVDGLARQLSRINQNNDHIIQKS